MVDNKIGELEIPGQKIMLLYKKLQKERWQIHQLIDFKGNPADRKNTIGAI
jgi:hypothetical protein